MFRIVLALSGVLVLTLISFGAYYKYNKNQLELAQANIATLEQAVNTNEETIEVLQNQYKRAIQTNISVSENLQQSRERSSLLARRLAEHDISAIAEQRPGLVERVINNASDNVLRCFELQSGAELTEEEKSAKNANDFNRECPELFIPR